METLALMAALAIPTYYAGQWLGLWSTLRMMLLVGKVTAAIELDELVKKQQEDADARAEQLAQLEEQDQQQHPY